MLRLGMKCFLLMLTPMMSDESGDRGAEVVHWWAVDVHDVCAIWAGWVDEEGLVGECLTDGGFDAEDLSSWVD